jgi:hypothetical protein
VTSEPLPRQKVTAGQDAINAGRDVSITNHFVQQDVSGPTSTDAQKSWGAVPARNPGFRGRGELLGCVHDALIAGGQPVPHALLGLAGVGKTQVAAEYAHRYADDYDIVWWVDAERSESIVAQFVTLAVELGWIPKDGTPDMARRAVVSTLHDRPRWLLVFDSAMRPEHVAPWLPGGSGHVLITSTVHAWDELAVSREVAVFSRGESRTLLQGRVKGLADDEADKVAAEVGDLPLAVAQAALYMASAGVSAGQYVQLLRDRPVSVLEQGRSWQYPRSLAAAVLLTFDQMYAENPAAATVAAICAFLAPEPIPTGWFPQAADLLPDLLAEETRDPMAWGRVIYLLHVCGLLRVEANSLVMHCLYQRIIRDRLAGTQAAVIREMVHAVLAANARGDVNLPENWSHWARLLPHVLAADPATSTDLGIREAGLAASWYLNWRADYEAAHHLARDLYERWRDRFGSYDQETLGASAALAAALAALGRHAEACSLEADALERRRRVLGEGHPATLISENNLASHLRNLGDLPAVRDFDADVLERRRRILGEDHPDTLASAFGLAQDLRHLKDYQAARELDADTLARRGRVLGPDHPDTRKSEDMLGYDLRLLAEATGSSAPGPAT